MSNVNQKYIKIFKQTNILHDRFEQEKAFNYLIKNVDIDELPAKFFKEYYYYLGASALSGFEDVEMALYYFKLGLSYDEKSDLFYHALLLNMMGIINFTQQDIKKAKNSFDYSLEMLSKIEDKSISNYEKTLLIHFNTSKFYSELGEHEKVINICNQAIKLAVQENFMYHLEKIYYEKAFNLAKLERFESSHMCYIMSMMLAEAKDNIKLVEIIKNDLIDFNMNYELIEVKSF